MDINMSIVELDKHVFTKVAEWSVSNGLTVTRNMDVLQQLKEANIQNKTFRVFSRLEMPFLQRVVSNVTLSGNDQFEGFAKDLIDEIAKLKNFTYVLDVVPDCKPGHHDPTTDKWNGLVGMILDGVNTLCIAFYSKTVSIFMLTFSRKLIWRLLIWPLPTIENSWLTFLLHSWIWVHNFLSISVDDVDLNVIFFLQE